MPLQTSNSKRTVSQKEGTVIKRDPHQERILGQFATKIREYIKGKL